ncbi:NYN domain limkain-b1-type [Arabidopsis thaliana x Arabidopsis arenosa]|uniref:NYN domain limkain-b1-type n=1 Tax=Arabidopsis thaliana x Arabidopsis arenosa TaxID=1240361 RepID=A0A8T1ZQ71_9BRAS|nr:NYN domain limkain-b1-type [Arabidopsis thaliana x Arabidopsis arenosa]
MFRPSKKDQEAKTTLLWDIEDRPRPDHIQFGDIPTHFMTLLKESVSFHGPLSISAYGDAQRLIGNPRPNGIEFNQVPSGDRDGRLHKILVDSLLWVIDNLDQPSNLVLVVGNIAEDSDFVKSLTTLKKKNCLVVSQTANTKLIQRDAWKTVLGRESRMANNFIVKSARPKASSPSLASTSSSSLASDSLEDMVTLAYFGTLFENKRAEEYRTNMWVKKCEREACGTHTKFDLSSISKFWSSLITPTESSSSHKDALDSCLNRAKQFASDVIMKKRLNDITSSLYMRQKPFFFKAFSLSDYKRSMTIVMWDWENCNVPAYCDPEELLGNIKTALYNLGYTGDIVMRGYGDEKVLKDGYFDKLALSGIRMTHVPPGKDASDKRLLNSIYFWGFDNPAPCNILFITSDGDFATATIKFKAAGYNTMIAHLNKRQTRSKKLTPSRKMIQESSTAWIWRLLAFGRRPYKWAT